MTGKRKGPLEIGVPWVLDSPELQKDWLLPEIKVKTQNEVEMPYVTALMNRIARLRVFNPKTKALNLHAAHALEEEELPRLFEVLRLYDLGINSVLEIAEKDSDEPLTGEHAVAMFTLVQGIKERVDQIARGWVEEYSTEEQ